MDIVSDDGGVTPPAAAVNADVRVLSAAESALQPLVGAGEGEGEGEREGEGRGWVLLRAASASVRLPSCHPACRPARQRTSLYQPDWPVLAFRVPSCLSACVPAQICPADKGRCNYVVPSSLFATSLSPWHTLPLLAHSSPFRLPCPPSPAPRCLWTAPTPHL